MNTVLFQSWSDVRRKKTKVFLNMLLSSFIFGNIMIIFGVIVFLWEISFCSIIIPIINIQATYFFGRFYFAKMNRELTILKEGILIPIGFPSRKFIPYNDISHINLYIKEKKNYIEFVLNNEMKFIYPKGEIVDWERFCKVLDEIEINVEE